MYHHRRIQLFYNFTSLHVVIFLLIGLTHGIKVYTDGEVQAEYRGSTTLSCRYEPPSSSSSYFRVLWSKGDAVLIYIGEFNSKTTGRYSLTADYMSGNLTINDVQLDDEGQYTCEVQFGSFLGETSHVNLRVVATPDELGLRSRTESAPLAIHQGVVTLKPGLETTFVCEAIGSRPAVTIEWYIDGVDQDIDQGTQTPNSQDDRLSDTTSSFVIANPGQFHHGQSLTCRAIREGKMIRNTSIIIIVEKPPNESIAVSGLNDHITTSTKQTPSCIAQDSFPASQITWFLGGENVTNNAESTTDEMTSGMMRVSSTLDYMPKIEDDGKILQCRVSHVALAEDIVAEKAICLNDTRMTVSVEQVYSTSLLLKLNGIKRFSSCTLSTCRQSRVNSSPGDECVPRYLSDSTYSNTIEDQYEIPDLVSSSTYLIILRCHHSSCGESTSTAIAETTGAGPAVFADNTEDSGPAVFADNTEDSEQQPSSENVWIRELIFVIIAVIVVSAFVIVVVVSVVLRAVVKGSIRAARAQVENHVPTSPDRARISDGHRSSILSSWSNNLYTIEEGNEGESKIYHEIKESRSSLVDSRSSLVEPSDILVSPLPSSQQRYTARLSMRHPRPPPLPPPVNRLSLDPAVLAASDSSDMDSDRDEYVPMTPDTYSIDSDYMAMNSVNTN